MSGVSTLRQRFSQPAANARVLPSVVPAPVLFGYGVACAAGSTVLPGREEAVKTTLEQGSRANIFGQGLQKMRVEKPGWRA